MIIVEAALLGLQRLGVREHVVFGGRWPTDPHGPLERATPLRRPAPTAVWRQRYRAQRNAPKSR